MLPGKAGSRRAASSTSKDSDVSSAFQIWRELQSARPQAARNSVGSMARAISNSYLHKSYMKLCSALRPSTKCAAALELADEKEKLCTLPRAEVGQSRSSLRSHGSTSGASRNGFSTQLAASIPIGSTGYSWSDQDRILHQQRYAAINGFFPVFCSYQNEHRYDMNWATM
jgi:hypothetical protein